MSGRRGGAIGASIDCEEMLHEIVMLGAGALSVPAKGPAAHLALCEQCQLDLATCLTAWGRGRALLLAPQALARWRPVALWLCSKKEVTEDGERAATRAGFQLDQSQDDWWSRIEFEELEDQARKEWSVDADRIERVRTWLEEIAMLSRSVGGFFSPDESTSDSSPGLHRPRRKRDR